MKKRNWERDGISKWGKVMGKFCYINKNSDLKEQV